MENLLISWKEFLKRKRKRKDVADFQIHFMDNILALHGDLAQKTYEHGGYQYFKINDPKPRDIHKASVRDRLVHHAICKITYPFFDCKFIFDSYSCRVGKGTHRAVNRFREFGLKVSKNNTKTCWVLKCDIRKFFSSIDHEILKKIMRKNLHRNEVEPHKQDGVFWLLDQIVDSFDEKGKNGIGLPLGNLTSQLLVNIYMNEFDQFAKRELKIKHYIRYADDFVIFHEDKRYLENLIMKIAEFLEINLKLSLHPKKVSIATLTSGVDFLGWVHFSHHRTLRTSTKKRMLRNIGMNPKKEVICSYLGMISHGNAKKLEIVIRKT